MMYDQQIIAHSQCERARHHTGFPVCLDCQICGRGPCRIEMYTDTQDIPNRLRGVAVNSEGDAI